MVPAAEVALAAVQVPAAAEVALAVLRVQVAAALVAQVPAVDRAPELGLVPAVLRVLVQVPALVAVCISVVSAFLLEPAVASVPRIPAQIKASVSVRVHPIMKAISKKIQDFPLKQLMRKTHFPKKSRQEGQKSRESRQNKSLLHRKSF